MLFLRNVSRFTDHRAAVLSILRLQTEAKICQTWALGQAPNGKCLLFRCWVYQPRVGGLGTGSSMLRAKESVLLWLRGRRHAGQRDDETVPGIRYVSRSLSDIAFVTRRRRCGQMPGRRPGKTVGVFAGIR